MILVDYWLLCANDVWKRLFSNTFRVKKKHLDMKQICYLGC